MTAPVTEHARVFGGSGTLAGIVTEPPAGTQSRGAFVLLNAGVVHRVGPNRLHVNAARRLAALGFLAVRFDFSGLGDSASRRDTTPFDQASVLETREVMSAIQQEYGVSRFVTAGLCSGAVVAFRTAVADERVQGAVLINPQGFVQSPEWNDYVLNKTLARRYWRHKLLSPASWRRALTGRTNYAQLAAVMKRRAYSMLKKDDAVARVAGGLAAEFKHLQARGLRMLLACSEGDYGVDYLETILGPRFSRHGRVETVMLPRGDHSLTMTVTQDRFFSGLERWADAWSVPERAGAMQPRVRAAGPAEARVS